MTWTVHKFGGTSVANADRYRDVAKIILELKQEPQKAVVVSAMKGVTDALIKLVVTAEKQDVDWQIQLEKLKKQHFDTIIQLTPGQSFLTEQIQNSLAQDFSNISEILRGVFLTKIASQSVVELISGFGEVWSAQLLNAYFQSLEINSSWLDARQVLVVIPNEKSVTVDFVKSQQKLDAWFKVNKSELIIITGFVASTHEGLATTLKRNGSDFSVLFLDSCLMQMKS